MLGAEQDVDIFNVNNSRRWLSFICVKVKSEESYFDFLNQRSAAKNISQKDKQIYFSDLYRNTWPTALLVFIEENSRYEWTLNSSAISELQGYESKEAKEISKRVSELSREKKLFFDKSPTLLYNPDIALKHLMRKIEDVIKANTIVDESNEIFSRLLASNKDESRYVEFVALAKEYSYLVGIIDGETLNFYNGLRGQKIVYNKNTNVSINDLVFSIYVIKLFETNLKNIFGTQFKTLLELKKFVSVFLHFPDDFQLNCFNGYSISAFSRIKFTDRTKYLELLIGEVFQAENIEGNGLLSKLVLVSDVVKMHPELMFDSRVINHIFEDQEGPFKIKLISNADLLYLLLVSTPEDSFERLLELDKKFRIQECIFKYCAEEHKINLLIWFNEVITSVPNNFLELATNCLNNGNQLLFSSSKSQVQKVTVEDSIISFYEQEPLPNYLLRNFVWLSTGYESDGEFEYFKTNLEVINSGISTKVGFHDLVYVLYNDEINYPFFKRKTGQSEIISSALLAVLFELHGTPEELVKNVTLGTVGLCFGVTELLVAFEEGLSLAATFLTITEISADIVFVGFEFIPDDIRLKYKEVENLVAILNLVSLFSRLSLSVAKNGKLIVPEIVKEFSSFFAQASKKAKEILESGYIAYNSFLIKKILKLCENDKIKIYLIKKNIHVMSKDGKFLFTLDPDFVITSINARFSPFEQPFPQFEMILKDVKIRYSDEKGNSKIGTIHLDLFSSKTLSSNSLGGVNIGNRLSYQLKISTEMNERKIDYMLYNKIHKINRGFPPSAKGLVIEEYLDNNLEYFALINESQLIDGELTFVNWITDEKFSNLKELRNRLSLLTEFKDPKKSRLLFIKLNLDVIKKPKNIGVKSIVGALFDKDTGLLYDGGANQWELLRFDPNSVNVEIIMDFDFLDYEALK